MNTIESQTNEQPYKVVIGTLWNQYSYELYTQVNSDLISKVL